MASLAISPPVGPQLCPINEERFMNGLLPQLVVPFLGLADSLVNYSQINRAHCAALRVLKEVKVIKIPSSRLNSLFVTASKFPHLQSLTLIDRIVGQPSLIEAGGIAPRPRAHFPHLTKLDLSRLNASQSIHRPQLLEILESSLAFSCLHLGVHPISNFVLEALCISPTLVQLDLGHACDEAEYTILARCQGLEQFVPGRGCSAAALIAIIGANNRLERLDLVHCDPNCVTDDVLLAIAECLPCLQKITFPLATIVKKKGFTPLIEKCRQLQSLKINTSIFHGEFEGIHGGLALKEIYLRNIHFTSELLESISTLSTLTILDLSYSRGFTPEELKRSLLKLTNLKILHLNAIHVLSEGLINALLECCTKLELLTIRWSTPSITSERVQEIEQAFQEGRSSLRILSSA